MSVIGIDQLANLICNEIKLIRAGKTDGIQSIPVKKYAAYNLLSDCDDNGRILNQRENVYTNEEIGVVQIATEYGLAKSICESWDRYRKKHSEEWKAIFNKESNKEK